MPESRDLALQAIAGRTRLVAEQQFAVSAGQLADEVPDRLWRVVDLAEEADLALAPLLGQGNRDLQLGGIQTDKHFASLRHGSSLVRKARRRPIRNNPRSSHRGDEPPPPETNIRSVSLLAEALSEGSDPTFSNKERVRAIAAPCPEPAIMEVVLAVAIGLE